MGICSCFLGFLIGVLVALFHGSAVTVLTFLFALARSCGDAPLVMSVCPYELSQASLSSPPLPRPTTMFARRTMARTTSLLEVDFLERRVAVTWWSGVIPVWVDVFTVVSAGGQATLFVESARTSD